MSSSAGHSEPEWRARRRRTILDAARILFAKSSYDAVQMDEIADLASVGKPTLYRYFPSKRDLYLNVCAEAFAELSQRLASAASRDAPPLNRLGEILIALLEVLSEQLVTLDFLKTSDAVLTRSWRGLYSKHRQEVTNNLTAVIDVGIQSSEFRAVDSDFLAHVLMGAARGALLETPVRSANEIVTNLLDILLLGLSPSNSRRNLSNAAYTLSLAAASRI